MRASGDAQSVMTVTARAGPRRRRTGDGARKAGRRQHLPAHHVDERLSGGVLHQLLHDLVAAAGVTLDGAGHPIDDDRRRIRRRPAREDRLQVRQGVALGIAGIATNGDAGAMREQLPERDRRGGGERIGLQLPGRQRFVHVPIQIQLPLVDQAQGGDRGQQFGERCRLETRRRVHRGRLAVPGAPQAFRPGHAAILDQRDADSGHMVARHPFRQRPRRRGPVIEQHGRQQCVVERCACRPFANGSGIPPAIRVARQHGQAGRHGQEHPQAAVRRPVHRMRLAATSAAAWSAAALRAADRRRAVPRGCAGCAGGPGYCGCRPGPRR